MNKKVVLGILFWLISTLIVGIITSFLFDLPKFVSMRNQGQPINGKIIGLRDDQRILSYSYQVGDRVYTSEFFGDKGNTFVGKDIPITFDPRNPADHLVGDLKANLCGRVVGVLFFSFIPTLAFARLLVWEFNRRTGRETT